MKEHIDYIVEYLKQQPIKGCITGSALLGYFDGQDVDLFVYDEKSFTKILFNLQYNSSFLILDPLEQWKLDQFINKEYNNIKLWIAILIQCQIQAHSEMR